MTSIPTCLGTVFVNDKGSRDQPAALLWPSLFTDHRMWDEQVKVLRHAGWRTVAVDPPSHGRSAGVDRGFTMDECATAALEVLDALAIDKPALVLGTSWGGFVAPRIALRAPNRVKGLILFNTSAQQPLLSQRFKGTMLTAMMRSAWFDGLVDRINLSTLLAAATLRDRPEIGAAVVRNYRSWDRSNLIAAIESVLLTRKSLLAELPAIKAPTLVVSGAQDTILPSKLSRTITAALPNAAHVEVASAAHLVPLDAPTEANALILDFVGRFAN